MSFCQHKSIIHPYSTRQSAEKKMVLRLIIFKKRQKIVAKRMTSRQNKEYGTFSMCVFMSRHFQAILIVGIAAQLSVSIV